MLRFKTIARFALESGYSEDAIRGKIRDGIWVEGRVWKKAPEENAAIKLRSGGQSAQIFPQHGKSDKEKAA